MHQRILLCFFLFCYTGLIAQKKDLLFDYYGFKEGFSSREAKNIVTTKNGMVWISTYDGLVSFDSKRFRTYKNNANDTNSLAQNNINNLITDKQGRIWVGGFNSVEVFNPLTEKFQHLRYGYPITGTDKPFDINFDYDAIKDIMWMTTRSGLYYCKGNSLQMQSVATLTKDSILIHAKLFSISREDAQYLWISTGFTLIRFNTYTGTVEKYQVPLQINKIVNSEKYSYIISSYLDKEKTLWLGTSRNGLIAFNTLTKQFDQYYYRPPENLENTIPAIMPSPIAEEAGLLYLSTIGAGLAVFDTHKKEFQVYKAEFLADASGIKDNALGLFVDAKKSLWIGATNGLYKLDFNKQIFNKIALQNNNNTKEVPPVTRMVCEQNSRKKDERVWYFIANASAGIYDLVNHKTLPIPTKIAKYIDPKKDFYTFYMDSKNRLWINNNVYGLICYAIEQDKIVIPEKKYFFTEKDWALTLIEDKAGNIWIGSKAGLFFMQPNADSILPITTVNNLLANSQLSQKVVSIAEDNTGKIWFIADYSTKPESCIGNYNLQTNTCNLVYKESKKANENKAIDNFENIFISKKNKVYVNDYGNGLLSFDANTTNPVFQNISAKYNLSPNYTRSFYADAEDNIWASTILGIAQYDTKKDLFTNYNYTNYAIDFNKYPKTFLSKQSGILYIGQSNSISYLNTKTVTKLTDTANLVFTDFQIFNAPFKPFKELLNSEQTIVLSHTQNMLTIEFALLSFFNATENMYSWKLEGLEKEWNTSKSNIATYANLQPGTYTLWVKAANAYGEWTNPIKLKIKIKAPFYKTWWFVGICLLLLAFLIYRLVNVKINRVKEKYKIRNKIASDLHDEVGSTLTSITILSNISQQAMEKKPEQAKEMLQKIFTQSKNIQQNMSDIVWSIRADNEKMENLVIRMREYAAATLEPLNIDITITAEDKLLNKQLPMDYRKAILLIYKEAITNISKHANASKVAVVFTIEKNKLQMQIKDNGTWKGTSTGMGTKSMSDRAIAMGGKLTITPNTDGTVVLLTVAIT
jgi:signal transduction histidine kinase/ligand-binding sensor domain-containing protein